MGFHSSQLGRSGHRDDRRRRLMAEEYAAGPAANTPPPPASGPARPPARKSENYGDADFMDFQLRLTDLIPRKMIAIVMLFVLGLTAILGLGALYVWTPNLIGQSAGTRIAMLDLSGHSSLAAWFSSLLLLTASVIAVLVYTVRRHKVDDYHGHYRVWLWAATCWFLMATDIAVRGHEGFQQIMIAVTGTRIVGDGSIWWVVPAVFLLGAVGSRLLVDMWPSRLSSTAFLLAAVCYAAAFAAYYRLIVLETPGYQILLEQGVQMGGHLLLVLAMCLYGRHVLLDVEGLIPRRAEKKAATRSKRKLSIAKREEDSEADEKEPGDMVKEDDQANDNWVVADPPHASAQPVLKRVAPAVTSAASSGTSKPAAPLASKVAFVGSTSSASDSEKMSKSDRKALKKRLLEERLQREQRTAAKW